jgi:hypothetical protein
MAEKILFQSMHSYGEGKGSGLQLTLDSYQGKPQVRLRETWLTPEGQERWSVIRPDSQGRCWAALRLNPADVAGLITALTQLSSELPSQPNLGGNYGSRTTPPRTPDASRGPSDDDIPF